MYSPTQRGGSTGLLAASSASRAKRLNSSHAKYKHRIADGKIQLLMNIKVNLPPDQQKLCRCVHQFHKSTLLAELNALRRGKNLHKERQSRLRMEPQRHNLWAMVVSLRDTRNQGDAKCKHQNTAHTVDHDRAKAFCQ
jgi:hypothetical protein